MSPLRSLLIESKWPLTGTTNGVQENFSPRAERSRVPVGLSSRTAHVVVDVSTNVTGGVPTRIPLSNLHNPPPSVPLGPLDPQGQLLKDRKKGDINGQGETVNTTHQALSDPGAAPVTTDETSPLGRRRTRGFFIRESERERAMK